MPTVKEIVEGLSLRKQAADEGQIEEATEEEQAPKAPKKPKGIKAALAARMAQQQSPEAPEGQEAPPEAPEEAPQEFPQEAGQEMTQEGALQENPEGDMYGAPEGSPEMQGAGGELEQQLDAILEQLDDRDKFLLATQLLVEIAQSIAEDETMLGGEEGPEGAEGQQMPQAPGQEIPEQALDQGDQGNIPPGNMPSTQEAHQDMTGM